MSTFVRQDASHGGRTGELVRRRRLRCWGRASCRVSCRSSFRRRTRRRGCPGWWPRSARRFGRWWAVARGSGPHVLAGFEILMVDDGSTDESPRVLAGLVVDHAELRPLRLARNAGQSAATRAGFQAARGQWVAILDADLQNDPADLAKLWDLLPGHDAGLGWRIKREDKWSKRVISKAGEPGAGLGFGGLGAGHGVRGADLPAAGGVAVSDVPRGASVLRAAVAPRGLPDRSDAVPPSAEAAWEFALQHLEPVAERDGRPAGRGVADASAGAL